MKLCQECNNSELLGKYRACKAIDGNPICINARSEEGECGPDASLFEEFDMTEITTPPIAPVEGDRDARRRINQILNGKTNNFGSVTLTANSASTTLNDTRIGINSVIFFQPTTANAAAAITNLYPGTPGDQTVTLNHANNAQTDRTFLYTIVG